MDTYSSRANTIFCTFCTVLGTTAVLNHLSTFLPMDQFDVHTSGALQLNKVHDLVPNSHFNSDQSVLSFHLNHNLAEEFHWNMNQLFLYVVATYNDTESNKRNEVTIYDKIIRSPEAAKFKQKNVMIEYPLRDQVRELRDRKVRLHARYRTMPIVGLMHEKEVASVDIQVVELPNPPTWLLSFSPCFLEVLRED
eukprot:symbB.v1.2.019639.t1/scaffold1617.1/size109270/3